MFAKYAAYDVGSATAGICVAMPTAICSMTNRILPLFSREV